MQFVLLWAICPDSSNGPKRSRLLGPKLSFDGIVKVSGYFGNGNRDREAVHRFQQMFGDWWSTWL
jgi:hypothetical protein